MIKFYLSEMGDYGGIKLIPFNKLFWTGRWKITTIDGHSRMSMERTVMLLGLIPLWREWVDENDLVIREEEEYVAECVKGIL